MGVDMAKMQDMEELSRRIIVWYSDGVASTVAAKLTLDKYPNAILVYTSTNSEHPDNVRYRKEVEKWLGKKVLVLKSEKYTDIWDVFERTGWLVGPKGARCTTELKKKLRQGFERSSDLQVFGYTVDEKERTLDFIHNNPEINISVPLIDRGISKSDCLDIVEQAGIQIPMMYRFGFLNNNCIGCVKGGQKYWARIRKHFPEVFARMSKVERELDVAVCKSYKRDETDIDGEDSKRKKLFLDELPEDTKITEPEQSISCGLFCGQYMEEDDD